NNRANALRRLGRLSAARSDYEASMRIGNPHPEYPDYGMGQIAEALGQPAAAVEYYRSALAANPQFTLAEDRLVAMDAGGVRTTATIEATPTPVFRHGRRLKGNPAQARDVDAA